METNWNTTAELNTFITLTADRIVAEGTQRDRRTLEMMASAVQPFAPGAAAALNDWDGSEVARLRAFGIVHGVLVRELGAPAQAEPLAQLNPAPALVLAA
ncbi:hypothetical protein [Pseudarthrobacter sp. MDT3-1]